MNQSHLMNTINKDGIPYVSVINKRNTFSGYNRVNQKAIQLDKSCINEFIETLKLIKEN